MISKPKKAVFLDRDGTIIEDRGFLKSPSDVVFFPETLEALKILRKEGFLLFIVTNQAGVARKIITEDDMEAVNRHILGELSANGIKIEEVFCCPHDDSDNCECRKPSPFFLKKAADKHRLDLKKSYMVGDHPSDVGAGLNCGAKGIYILTGHGIKHRSEAEKMGALILPDILAAAEWMKICAEIEKIHRDGGLPEKIEKAARAIKGGGTVLMPTETVYGLGADATNPEAVEKIFRIKRRPANDPLIVHVSDMKMLEGIVERIPEKAMLLAERFWPGPLTLVLRKKPIVPDIVTAGLPTVAVRMPMHPIAGELIKKSNCPISAPSANLFSCLSPTRYSDVAGEILQRCDMALSGGDCLRGIESTIVSFSDEEQPALLRAGSLAVEKIESLIGPLARRHSSSGSSEAPGLQRKHYSPRTPLFLIKNPSEVPADKRAKSALICFSEDDLGQVEGFAETRILFGDCEFRSAASSLFSTLSELDRLGLDGIYAVPAEERGLGIAINDRLRRAAAK